MLQKLSDGFELKENISNFTEDFIKKYDGNSNIGYFVEALNWDCYIIKCLFFLGKNDNKLMSKRNRKM